MELAGANTRGTSDGRPWARDEVTSSAHSTIAALARGVVPSADLAFPWPPPSYVWRRRTAERILASGKQRNNRRENYRGRVLSLGSQTLDKELAGCFARGSLVEIVGQAGTGKTQLALTLAAETIIQLYDLNKPDAHRSNSYPAISRYQDTARDATKDSGQSSDYEVTEAHPPGSCSLSSSGRIAGGSLKGCTQTTRRPAVVYYLHTEGAFPVKRLRDILLHRLNRRKAETAEPAVHHKCARKECETHPVDTDSDLHLKLLMQRVFTEEVFSEEQLWTNLTRRLPRLTIQYRIVLVVLDSIAAIFRPTVLENVPTGRVFDCSYADALNTRTKLNKSHHPRTGLVDRASKLLRIGALLRRLCCEHDFCCLVLNQVSDTVKEDSPLSPMHSGCDVNVPMTEFLERPITNSLLEPTVLGKEKRKTGWLSQVCSRSDFCGADGMYIWKTRNAHGPILEHLGVQPALGLTWGNCINTRLVLQKMRALVTCSSKIYDDGVGGVPMLLRRCRAIFGYDVNISRDVLFAVDGTGVVDAGANSP